MADLQNRSNNSPRPTAAAGGNVQKAPRPPKPVYAPPSIIKDAAQNKRYKLGHLLGTGGFAQCYVATDIDTGKEYAAKVVLLESLKKPATREKLVSEIKIHKSLCHRYIVPYESYFECGDAAFMILGLCTNKTLMDMMKARKVLTEPEVQILGLQLLEGLQYLHEEKLILHRDLKLGNLLLNNNMEINIADFGLAAQLEHKEDARHTICGTPNYIAPEVLEERTTRSGHSFECDIWGYGVVLFTLLFGKPPFETTDVEKTYKKIRNGEFRFPQASTVSPAARDLIEKILQKLPEDRLTLGEIRDQPFFRNPPPLKSLPVTALTQVPVFPPRDYVTNATMALSSRFQSLALSTPKTPQQRVENEFEDMCRTHTKLEMSLPPNRNATSGLLVIPGKVHSKEAYSGIVTILACAEDTQYGVGYMLSNGVYQVKFNDSTYLSHGRISDYYRYLEKGNEVGFHASKMQESTVDPQLKKKYRILKMMQEEMESKLLKDLPIVHPGIMLGSATLNDHDYVVKRLPAKHGWLNKLAGGTYQMIFFDGTDLAIHVDTHKVIFSGKDKVKVYTTFDDIVDHHSIFTRAMYIKNTIAIILRDRRQRA